MKSNEITQLKLNTKQPHLKLYIELRFVAVYITLVAKLSTSVAVLGI